MDRLYDPRLFPLPHPVRTDAVLGSDLDARVFQELGLTAELRPYLTDDTLSTEWLINHLPLLHLYAQAHIGLPGSVNLGTFILMMSRARLRAHGDPILTVTPTLQALLSETDLIKGLPSRYFRCPFPLAYVAFARPNELRIPNQLSGLHEFEGAYVGTYTLAPHHPMFENDQRQRSLNLDPDLPTRLVELTLVGSPVGKDNCLDDASQDLVLYIQNEDECLSTLLERHLDYYQSKKAYTNPGMRPAKAEEVLMVRPIVMELAKVLLYLNLAEAQQLPEHSRDELERKFRKYGKLTAPRQAKLATAYNHILIGPSTQARIEGQSPKQGESAFRLRPHWRRGHFKRIHFGEKLSETRLGWIQPYLVHKDEAFGTVKTKEYVVR